MSDFPVGPTVRRVAAYLARICKNMHEKVSENILHFFIMAYLTATLMAAFAPPTDMEAIQILPDRSWSATVRNLEGVISHIKEIRSCQSSKIN